MKKIIFLAFITLFMSCKAYQIVSKITEQVYIGMHINEFLKVAKGRAEKDVMLETYYAYRINQYDIFGYRIQSMFYYFNNSDDKLFKVDEGVNTHYNYR